MQRRIAGAGRIRIGAPVEQQPRDRAIALKRRQHESGVAIGRGVVHIGAAIEQQPCRLDIAAHRREQQCRAAARLDGVRVLLRGLHARRPLIEHHRQAPHHRARLHVGAVLEQHFDDVRMTLGRSPHQRRLLPLRFGGVDICFSRQQRAHDRDVAGASRAHQRRDARIGRRIRVGAARQQALDDSGVAVFAGQRQRRDRQVVGAVDARAGGDQQHSRFPDRRDTRPNAARWRHRASAALTSARCFSSDRTAATSRFLAACTSGTVPAAIAMATDSASERHQRHKRLNRS